MEVKSIVPLSVETFPTANPTEVKVTSPRVVAIAPVIILFPSDEIFILPFSFVIALDIDKFDADLFVISIFPTLLTAPERFTVPVPF